MSSLVNRLLSFLSHIHHDLQFQHFRNIVDNAGIFSFWEITAEFHELNQDFFACHKSLYLKFRSDCGNNRFVGDNKVMLITLFPRQCRSRLFCNRLTCAGGKLGIIRDNDLSALRAMKNAVRPCLSYFEETHLLEPAQNMARFGQLGKLANVVVGSFFLYRLGLRFFDGSFNSGGLFFNGGRLVLESRVRESFHASALHAARRAHPAP